MSHKPCKHTFDHHPLCRITHTNTRPITTLYVPPNIQTHVLSPPFMSRKTRKTCKHTSYHHPYVPPNIQTHVLSPPFMSRKTCKTCKHTSSHHPLCSARHANTRLITTLYVPQHIQTHVLSPPFMSYKTCKLTSYHHPLCPTTHTNTRPITTLYVLQDMQTHVLSPSFMSYNTYKHTSYHHPLCPTTHTNSRPVTTLYVLQDMQTHVLSPPFMSYKRGPALVCLSAIDNQCICLPKCLWRASVLANIHSILAYDVPDTEDVGLTTKFRFNVGPALQPIAGSMPINPLRRWPITIISKRPLNSITILRPSHWPKSLFQFSNYLNALH